MLNHLISWQFNGGNQANFFRLMVNVTGLNPVFLWKTTGRYSWWRYSKIKRKTWQGRCHCHASRYSGTYMFIRNLVSSFEMPKFYVHVISMYIRSLWLSAPRGGWGIAIRPDVQPIRNTCWQTNLALFTGEIYLGFSIFFCFNPQNPKFWFLNITVYGIHF